MPEDKIEKLETPSEQTSSKTPSATKKRKIKGKNRLARWFREMRSELNKVVWPTPKQVVNNTSVALTVMACMALLISALDFAASQIFRFIITFIPSLLGG